MATSTAGTVPGAGSTSDREGWVPPYAPSWVNVLTAWMERLPGPTWLAYIAGMLIGIAASYALIPGAVSLASDAVGLVYYGALPFAALGLIHRLDRTAGEALRDLRPILEASDSEIRGIHHELTVVPRRPAAVLALIAFAITPIGYILDPAGAGIVGYSPALLGFRYLEEAGITAIFLVLVYHTIRQLRTIAQIHSRLGRIDLFDQAPLYSTSKLTSRTAIGLILLLIPSLFLIPGTANASYLIISAGWYGGAIIIAGAAFVLPLRGIHDRIADEKRRLQREVGRRLSTTIEGIHAAVDSGDGSTIEARDKALSTLIAERDLVNKVPTWPWSTGALTGFLSAVLLPLGLWVVTRLLERLV